MNANEGIQVFWLGVLQKILPTKRRLKRVIKKKKTNRIRHKEKCTQEHMAVKWHEQKDLIGATVILKLWNLTH